MFLLINTLSVISHITLPFDLLFTLRCCWDGISIPLHVLLFAWQDIFVSLSGIQHICIVSAQEKQTCCSEVMTVFWQHCYKVHSTHLVKSLQNHYCWYFLCAFRAFYSRPGFLISTCFGTHQVNICKLECVISYWASGVLRGQIFLLSSLCHNFVNCIF